MHDAEQVMNNITMNTNFTKLIVELKVYIM
jgi:hypothetical protein